jgi:hypothetical protein
MLVTSFVATHNSLQQIADGVNVMKGLLARFGLPCDFSTYPLSQSRDLHHRTLERLRSCGSVAGAAPGRHRLVDVIVVEEPARPLLVILGSANPKKYAESSVAPPCHNAPNLPQ